MVSDKVLASEEGIKKLEAEGKLAQERVQEIDSLSSKLAEKEEELRTKEKELEISRMLAQAKSEEAAELKVRLDWVTAEELRMKEKELEILRMLAQAKSEEVDGLKRLDGVIAEEELRNKETESEVLQMLAQAKSEEAAELKVRLDRVTSPSVAPSEQWVSLEDYKAGPGKRTAQEGHGSDGVGRKDGDGISNVSSVGEEGWS